ncbi:MAG: hypothetical protein COA65_06095 [Rhodospirillaceae bacterium]|nr:MAG: hypothetical protein COA65_06095 [Rhodospirillaceae bacterium]
MVVSKEGRSDNSKPKPPAIPSKSSLEGPELAAAESLVQTVREQSADSLSFASEMIKTLHRRSEENVRILLNQDDSPANIVAVASRVLEVPKIRTQIVHGFLLDSVNASKRDMKDSPMLAIWESLKNEWIYINPNTGMIGLPDNYLIWWTGESPMFNIEGGGHFKSSVSAQKTAQNALDLTQRNLEQQHPNIWKFSLFSLPLHTQVVYQVMIMIPLGAFIILLLRNLVGIQTFGTFMPVLVALAFRETNLISGIILFSIVIGIGLLVRFYLEHLKLLLVPRIAAVLSSVVIIMILLSIISYHLGIEYGLSIALFPMVIMTMTIERMSVVWEERNPWEAILQVIGSLFAASIAYLAMNVPLMMHLFFTFPELLLVLMSAMLLLGRYRGYRLSELWRFNSLMAHELAGRSWPLRQHNKNLRNRPPEGPSDQQPNPGRHSRFQERGVTPPPHHAILAFRHSGF